MSNSDCLFRRLLFSGCPLHGILPIRVVSSNLMLVNGPGQRVRFDLFTLEVLFASSFVVADDPLSDNLSDVTPEGSTTLSAEIGWEMV